MSKKTNIGICFGGYCPLHQGHMDVIMRAKKENDICYVIVCGYDNEPRGWEINLDLDQRFEIIKEFFKNDEQIRVRKINDTALGIDESMSNSNWTIWQTKVKNFIATDFPEQHKYEVLGTDGAYHQYYTSIHITWYVAEEFYKRSIEKNNVLNAKVCLVEKTNPVSGTQIRKNPLQYWNKIAEPFRKYLTKNILVVGTASEGKSTLVRDIARYFGIPYSDEWAIGYMKKHKLKDKYLTVSDLAAFLEGQAKQSLEKICQTNNGLFIADSDACVTLMYGAAYAEDDDINVTKDDYERTLLPLGEKMVNKIKWDHIFVFPPDKDFVDDGRRYMKQSSMEERQKNFVKLQKLLNTYYPEVSKTYLIGSFYENFNSVKSYINSLID